MALRFREKDLRITRTQNGEVVYYLVEDPTRPVQHRLYELEYEVAQLLDGRRSTEKVARLISKKRKVALTAIDIEKFARQLEALGFVVEE